MDPLSTIDPGTSASTTPASSNAFSSLDSEAFVKIIFTELSKQDPLKPNDSNALLQQMSSLRSIQSDIDLSSKLESLVSQNQLASAGGLIGKYISGVDEQNTRVVGLVESVSRTSDGPVLNLHDGSRVRFSNIDEMLDPAQLVGSGAQQPGGGS